MNGFNYKQCPNGHYYQGDACPYCPSSKASEKQMLVRVLKACHNLHAYDAKLNMCPICGSSIVVDKFTSKSTDTALSMSIHLTNPVHVKVGASELSECNYIQVALPHCYKHGYFFTATHNYCDDEALEIKPDKKIVFGTLTMTGKEFIRLCDLIFDNNLSIQSYSDVDVSPDELLQLTSKFKQCPNGHNFQEEQSSHKPVEDIGPYTAPYTCKACGAWSSEYNGGHCPYCGVRLKGQPEDINPWWLDNEHKTTIIPVCEHCGHRIRKSIPSSFIQDYNNIIPPWNHEWDGKCEFCGHDYSIHIGMPVFFSKKKKTYVKADSKIIGEPCNLDQYRVLSGVTIKTEVGNEAEKNCEHGEVFLTANELKVLIKLLKDSPLLEQYDYDDSNYM